MASLNDIANGAAAQAADVQQIIDLLKGTAGKGVPVSLAAVNDALNYALAVKNNDASASKAFIVYKADGTILFQIDKNGVIASADGTTAAGQLVTATGSQTLTNKTLSRLKLGGTACVVGDFVLSAGWGTGASISNVTGNDSRGTFQINVGTGPSMFPTVTFTFHDGTWGSAPFVMIRSIGGAQQSSTEAAWTQVVTATSVIWTWLLGGSAPPASGVMVFEWLAIG